MRRSRTRYDVPLTMQIYHRVLHLKHGLFLQVYHQVHRETIGVNLDSNGERDFKVGYTEQYAASSDAVKIQEHFFKIIAFCIICFR